MILSGRKTFLITGFIILLVGIGLIVGGIFFNNSTNSKLKNWPTTYATVTGYTVRRETDSDGYERMLYSATVEYTVDGRTYKKTENSSSSIKPSVGTSREIAYNPDDPSDAVFTGDSVILPTIIICVCGGGFVIGGLLTLVTYARKK